MQEEFNEKTDDDTISSAEGKHVVCIFHLSDRECKQYQMRSSHAQLLVKDELEQAEFVEIEELDLFSYSHMVVIFNRV